MRVVDTPAGDLSWACTSQHCIHIPATNHVCGNLMPSEHGAHCCLSFAAARDLICVNPEFQHVTSQSYRFRLAQVARPSLVLRGQTGSAENTFKSTFFPPWCTNLYKIIQLNIFPPSRSFKIFHKKIQQIPLPQKKEEPSLKPSLPKYSVFPLICFTEKCLVVLT